MKSLAIQYRPKTWDDLTEQNSIKTILKSYEDWLLKIKNWDLIDQLFAMLVKLQSDIKYSSSPKYDIEASLLLIGGNYENC